MSWLLERRDADWHVVREDGTSEGSHGHRVDAIKHQRALYAREALVAAMYADLDARPEPDPPAVTLKIEALTAAVMERIAERQALTDQALVAALQAIGTREPVVNVHPTVQPTPVTVEAPHVTVEAPHVTVEAPAVNVPAAQITVQPADVNVMMPERQKTVTFKRDPLTQQVTKAEITEGMRWTHEHF